MARSGALPSLSQSEVGYQGKVVGREDVLWLDLQDAVSKDFPFRVYQDAVNAPQADPVQLEGWLADRLAGPHGAVHEPSFRPCKEAAARGGRRGVEIGG